MNVKAKMWIPAEAPPPPPLEHADNDQGKGTSEHVDVPCHETMRMKPNM